MAPTRRQQSDRARGERARRFFHSVVRNPKKILGASLALIVVLGAFLPRIQKDTRSDAFIPPGHESLLRRDEVRERFGLSDPIVVALVADERGGAESVFTPEGLALIQRVTQVLEEVQGIDTARITSLATEDDIIGSESGIDVRPFLEPLPRTQAEADAVRAAVMDFALHRGSLVSEDGRATVAIAETLPEVDAGRVYEAVRAMTESLDVPTGLALHVAGEAGVTGHLGHYIDADSRRMVPLALVLIVVALTRVYRSPRGVGLPLLVVVGGVVVAIGGMAALGVPYYLITTAVPVILVAIGVADGIHVLGQYYAEMAHDPDAPQPELVVRTMQAMWRPVTITSLTDAAGFLALAASSSMPPLIAFGVFAAVGVASTWGFSLLALPAALALLRSRPARVMAATDAGTGPFRGIAAVGLSRIGAALCRRPRSVALTACGLAGLGLFGATAVEIDYERIRNFRPEEPIHRADRAINQHLHGSNYLDVMVVAAEAGDLLEPQALRGIERFQQRMLTLEHVRGSTSIVDAIRQMHRAFDADRPESERVPDERAAVAQLMLLYDMQSDPDALEKLIDTPRQHTNVRVFLDSGRYSIEADVVRAAESQLQTLFLETGLRGHLAGRVNVDYHWMRGVAHSHFVSVLLALAAITLVSALLFRSMAAGLLTAAPVAVAVLGLYAFMAAAGLWLGITTAMFAAVAIGLGVDFSVHLIERLQTAIRDRGQSLEQALVELYPDTGRALLFNCGCCLIGFGVLATSQVPTLVEFGLLTGVAVAGSFLASMTMIPALVGWLRPEFLGLAPETQVPGGRRLPALRKLAASAIAIGRSRPSA